MKMKSQGCVTLVGDHRQLPPTISNLTVDVEGFGTSLFERLASQGVQPYLLNIQYRMHPCISAFPSVMCLTLSGSAKLNSFLMFPFFWCIS